MNPVILSFAAALRGQGMAFEVREPGELRYAVESIPRDYTVVACDPDEGEQNPYCCRVQFLVFPHYQVPLSRIDEAVRLAAALNGDRLMGSWSVAPATGQPYFRLGFPADGPLRPSTCSYLVGLFASEEDRAIPLLLSVGEDGVPAAEACRFLLPPESAR